MAPLLVVPTERTDDTEAYGLKLWESTLGRIYDIVCCQLLNAASNSIAAWNVTVRGLTKTRHEGSKVLYVVTATKVDVEQ